MGHGDKKYMRAAKRCADARVNSSYGMTGWGSTWAADFIGVFLSEYYILTGDKSVLPKINWMIGHTTASMYNRMENKNGAYYGTFGHYINPDMDAQEGVYKMTVTTAGIGYFWAMASSAGLDVPMKYWDGVTYHIKRATGRNGGMGYCGPGGGSQSHPRVSNAMLALSCAPKGRRHDDNLKKLGTFLEDKNNFGSVMFNHGVTITPFYRSSIALYRTNKKAYREYMDYWKWFIVLTRGPDNRAIYWDMAAAGGDIRLGKDSFMNGAIGVMMAAAKARLFMYEGMAGVSPRNLSAHTSAAYKLMRDGKLPKAFKHLNRNAATIDANKEDAHAAKLMKKFIVDRVAPMIAKLQELDKQPDVLVLREHLDRYQNLCKGITPFDVVAGPIESSFAKEPRKSELRISKAYFKLVAGRSRERKWSTYYGKLGAFSRKYPDSYYAKAAAAEAESISAMARSKLAYFEKLKQYGDLYTLSERLKEVSRKFAGIEAFDKPALEYKQMISSTKNRGAVSLGHLYYKVFTDAARLKKIIAKQKRPLPEASVKRAFAPLARRLEGIAKRNPDSAYGKAAQEALKHYEQSNKMNVQEVWFSGKPARDERDKFFDDLKKREQDK